jgi:hypothetical protein
MPDPAGRRHPLDEAGCQGLLDFLETLAGRGRSAVLIASRTSEDWLGGIRRIAVGGLASHEAAGYAGELLAPYPAAALRAGASAEGSPAHAAGGDLSARRRSSRALARRTGSCDFPHASHGSLVGRRHAGKQRCECGAVLVPVVLATATRSRRTCRCRRLPVRNVPSAKSSPSWPAACVSHRAGSSHPAPLLNLGHLRPHGRRDGQHVASPATTCDAPSLYSPSRQRMLCR